MEQCPWNILESLESNNMCNIAWPDEFSAEDYFAPELIASKGSMGTSCDAHVLSLHFCDLLRIRCESLADCQNSHHLPLRRLSRANKSLFLAEYPFLVFLGDL